MRSSLTLLIVLFGLTACEGEKGANGDAGADGAVGTNGADGADGAAGTNGADGADGTPGTDGTDGSVGAGFEHSFSGTVTGADGVWPDALVSAHMLDSDGQAIVDLGGVWTDDTGSFEITLGTINAPTHQLLLMATSPDGDVLKSLAATDDVALTPASSAVTEIIEWIVASEGGRSPLDFDTTDYPTLVTDAEAALTAAGTDQSDWDAVVAQVLEDVGGDIADASGGTYTYESATIPFSTEGAGVQTSATTSYQYLYDGLGYEWDIYTYYGYVSDGGADPYDGHGYMYVDGEVFNSGTSVHLLEDTYEVVLSDTLGGLDITRKIYVDPTYGFARWIDSYENNSGADITTDIYVYGDMGPGSTTITDYTSSGDDDLDSSDSWWVSGNDSDGSTSREVVGQAHPGGTCGVENGDQVFCYYNDTFIADGDRVTIMRWEFQRDANAEADLAAELTSDFTAAGVPIGGEYYADMSYAEYFDHITALVSENIVGEAGSVAPYAVVTVENTTQAITTEETASSDGSFAIGIPADSGDTVSITATDGTSATLIIP